MPRIAAGRRMWTKATRATSLHCCAASCVQPPAGSATVCASSSCCSAVVAIAETFRISEIALSGYIVLFLSGREAASTVLTALLAGIAVVLAIFVTIAVFMLSLSEPALRIPLMAAMTFVAMFLSRTATPGPVFFVAGFIIAYGLTLGDQVLGLALQPATAGNAEQFALPEIVFVPPEEALVRFLLWLSLAVALPVVLLIAANLLTGRDPALLLYQRAGRAAGNGSTLLRRRERSGTPARSPSLRGHSTAAQAAPSRRTAAPRPAPPRSGARR